MQKLPFLGLAACVAGLLLSACDASGIDGSNSTVEQLVGPTWQLATLQNSEGDDEGLNEDEAYIISFGEDGKLNGRADCNSYFATYDAEDGGYIAVDSLGSTQVYCGEESHDEVYMKGIGTASEYEITGDRLRIGFEQEGVLTFKRTKPEGEK